MALTIAAICSGVCCFFPLIPQPPQPLTVPCRLTYKAAFVHVSACLLRTLYTLNTFETFAGKQGQITECTQFYTSELPGHPCTTYRLAVSKKGITYTF
jgi:hypothetical protein